LVNESLFVEVWPQRGMTVAAIGLRQAEDSNLLWRRAGHVAPECSRALGPSGTPSIESLHDLFVGGWFEMSPHAGLPGTLDGAPTMLHGEALRLPWGIDSADPTRVEASVRAVRWPLQLRRQVKLRGERVEVRSEIRNESSTAIGVSQGEHPCFGRERFAAGRLTLEAERCEVLPPLDPGNASAAAGEFEWPLAPGDAGGVVDFSAIPTVADGSHDHVSITLASPRVVLSAPEGPRLCIEIDLDVHPHLLLWRNFRAASAPSHGSWDVFAIEPMSAPGRSIDDAVAAAATRRLEAGEAAAYGFAIAVSP